MHTKSEFCATCHNVTHPFNKLPVERTYDEWRDSIYNKIGVQCQDCHMAPNQGFDMNPGMSALDGKKRSQIYAHFFTGANVTLHNYFGQKDMSGRARELHRSAATIEFIDAPKSVRAGQLVTIKVKVTNVGAGHKLPTGFPEGREAWVDLQVRDAHGNEVYRLGAIRDGHTEEGTKSFKVVLADSNGKVVEINVWEADRILSDTRILPMGYALVDYTFRIPPNVEGPLTMLADLNYCSIRACYLAWESRSHSEPARLLQ